MSCEIGCIFSEPAHGGPCIGTDGQRLGETALSSRDRDAPRALAGQAAKPVIWGLPFACPDCRTWGYVPVCVENTRKTTDEQVVYFLGKKHRELSAACLRPPEKFILGRLRRRDDRGEMIYMLKEGETEHTPIDTRWPLWDLIN